MDSGHRTRRQFCEACTAAGVAALGGALATLSGCGGGGGPTSANGISAPALPRISGSVAGSAVQVTIDAASPLASAGSAALVTSGLGNLLVARTGADTFVALTAMCTHMACTITGFDQSYVCPCHGSRFDTSGRVLNGPATRSLQQYQSQFANGVLTITP